MNIKEGRQENDPISFQKELRGTPLDDVRKSHLH